MKKCEYAKGERPREPVIYRLYMDFMRVVLPKAIFEISQKHLFLQGFHFLLKSKDFVFGYVYI